MVLSENESREFYQKLIDELGDKIHIYIQPPESVKLIYPCLICELDGLNKRMADDLEYMMNTKYTLTLITRKLGGEGYVEKLIAMQYCSFDRVFTNDNLYHYVFTIYN